jgi:hypothetical protein
MCSSIINSLKKMKVVRSSSTGAAEPETPITQSDVVIPLIKIALHYSAAMSA